MIALMETPFEPSDALRRFEADASGAGAIVSFTGHVRAQAASGPVTSLYLQAHSPLTERGIEAAAQEARERWPLTGLTILHRTGEMASGEAIVFVATASAHRRAAFEAADYLMDYLKTEAIFWKKEAGPSGASWIEPRHEDYQDRKRWD